MPNKKQKINMFQTLANSVFVQFGLLWAQRGFPLDRCQWQKN